MRSRDVRICLFDMVRAADAVLRFVEDRTFEQYTSDLMVRSAVERQLEILGEAMSRALKIEPGIAAHLDEARGVVDFRNVIAHGYDVLSDRTVWDIAVNHVPHFRDSVAALLVARGD